MSSLLRRPAPPRGALRRLLRLPIWLYRLRLGRLLGERFLMLSHLGRKSRRLRQTVLEVVAAEPASRRYIVASGWGRQADWYRNILRTPRVLLDTAHGRHEALARQLDEAEAAAALERYASRHPRAFRQLSRVMIGRPLAAGADGCRELAREVPLVAFEPAERGGA
jgi:deazaflavin-dependent oxidoreductase (nitroreductase family)